MRILVILVVIAAAAGGGWFWWTNQDPEAERAALEAQAREQAAQTGMMRFLKDSSQFRFQTVVLGPVDEEGVRDFRGMAVIADAARPAYGRVKPVCDEGLERPECWAFTQLQIDGENMELTGGGQVAAAESGDPLRMTGVAAALARATGAAPGEEGASRGSSDDLESQLEAGSKISVTSEAPPAEGGAMTTGPTTTGPATTDAAATDIDATAEDSEAPEMGSAADEAAPEQMASQTVTPAPEGPPAPPVATHEVARPLVNTRLGPGTGYPVVTVAEEGVRLALEETDGAWGRFEILSGKSKGLKVWIALSVLQEISS